MSISILKHLERKMAGFPRISNGSVGISHLTFSNAIPWLESLEPHPKAEF